MKRIIFYLLSSAVLLSCSVKPPMTLKPELISKSSGDGLLIGSFSRINGKPRFNQYSFYFIDSLGNEREITIKPELITTVKYPDDFDTGEVSGSLFAFILPEGKYTFNRYYNLYQVSIGMYKDYNPSEDFNIPFEVRSGQISYVGEIRFYPKLKEGVTWIPKHWPLIDLSGGGAYYIHDSFQRDVKLFREKNKSIKNYDIKNITPKNVKIPALEEEVSSKN